MVNLGKLQSEFNLNSHDVDVSISHTFKTMKHHTYCLLANLYLKPSLLLRCQPQVWIDGYLRPTKSDYLKSLARPTNHKRTYYEIFVIRKVISILSNS